jgi:hypothetical protein
LIGGGYLLVFGHWSNGFSLIRFLGVILFDEEMFPFRLGPRNIMRILMTIYSWHFNKVVSIRLV